MHDHRAAITAAGRSHGLHAINLIESRRLSGSVAGDLSVGCCERADGISTVAARDCVPPVQTFTEWAKISDTNRVFFARRLRVNINR